MSLKAGDERMQALVARHPDGLQLVHRLAKSFADSIVQSSAPLTMRPQPLTPNPQLGLIPNWD